MLNKLITLISFIIISSVIPEATFAMLPQNQTEKQSKDDTSKVNTGKEPVRVYNTIRLSTSKPKIDGILNDSCWQTGEWSGDFTQLLPNEGAKPSQETLLKILYDDKNLYVAIQALDTEPDKIHRKAGRRDELDGDMMGVTFDSYHDHRTGFEFTVTAAGQKVDLILFNPMAWDVNWNAVWYVKVGHNDKGWVAEYQIPLSQLRYSNKDEQIWGLHCWRWINRIQEENDWEVQSMAGPGMLYAFGELHGIKGLKKSRRFELVPYALGKLETFEKEPGNPFADKGKAWGGALGFDAKIGISSNFTMDVSVNPDFGQVESDPSVMNLTAFETFFEEKRPFFLEGVNIFKYEFDEDNLFYSRRIGQAPSHIPTIASNEYMKIPDNTSILSAIKLSGKTSKGLSVGILQSLTANEFAEIKSETGERKETAEPMSSYFVARVEKDYKQGNTTVGGIVTSTNRFIKDDYLNFMNRNAYTGGLDVLHQWEDKKYYVQAKVIGSYIDGKEDAMTNLQLSSARYYQRPDATHIEFDNTLTKLSGTGGKIKIGKGSGLWRYSTDMSWHSPGLDLNDIGYMQMADLVKQTNNISYFVNKPVSIFRTYSVGLEEYNNWDFGGNYLFSGVGLDLSAAFKNQWGISNSFTVETPSLDTRILRGGDAMKLPSKWTEVFSMFSDNTKKVYFNLQAIVSASSNSSYKFYEISPGITVRPVNSLRFAVNANYSENFDKLQYIDKKDFNNDNRYLLGKINQQTIGLTFRVDYYITPELSIQYYGSPYISIGKYQEIKYVTNPKADEYDNRFSIYNNPVLMDNVYQLDENNDQVTDYTLDNPDFDFSQFRSNLVARWEYRPGSTFYLVWSLDKTYYTNPGAYSLSNASSQLKSIHPRNVFLIKFNYWFSI